jgi:hypothetical protein
MTKNHRRRTLWLCPLLSLLLILPTALLLLPNLAQGQEEAGNTMITATGTLEPWWSDWAVPQSWEVGGTITFTFPVETGPVSGHLSALVSMNVEYPDLDAALALRREKGLTWKGVLEEYREELYRPGTITCQYDMVLTGPDYYYERTAGPLDYVEDVFKGSTSGTITLSFPPLYEKQLPSGYVEKTLAVDDQAWYWSFVGATTMEYANLGGGTGWRFVEPTAIKGWVELPGRPTGYVRTPDYLTFTAEIHELVSIPPEVAITEPQDGQTFYSPPGEKLSIILRGTVTDKDDDVENLFISALRGKSVTGRGDVVPDDSGAFSCLIELLPGNNTISVKARDAGGNETEQSVRVTLEEGTPPTPPTEEAPQIVTEEEEAQLRASEKAKEVEEEISENKPTYDELKTEAPEGGTVDKVTLIPPEGTEEELADIQHTPKKKKAYILTSPELGTWHRIIMWPKKKAIMNHFEREGYELVVLEATNENIRTMVADSDTDALAYFGHNRFPTLENYDANGLQSVATLERRKRYMEQGMSSEEAKERVKSERFEVKYFYNHSCYSLGEEDKKDTSLFDGTLRSGGIGWGHQGSLHIYHRLTQYTKP